MSICSHEYEHIPTSSIISFPITNVKLSERKRLNVNSTLQTLNQVDPTQTTTIRNAFVREMNKRFRRIRGLIRRAIIDQDCFGLQQNGAQANVQTNANLPGKRAYAFDRTGDKIEGFMSWLREAVDDEILELKPGLMNRTGQAVDSAWSNMYIESAYQKGILNGRAEMLKADIPGAVPIDESGGIGAVFNQPIHADRVGAMYTRTFNDLRGITDSMDSQISRVLSQGMVDGKNPRTLARMLNKTIYGKQGDLALTDTLGRFIPAQRRAQTLARTEVIRAHTVAICQEYRNFAVEGVDVQAEFRTAGDGRVCATCESLQGTVHTIDEIETMIPVHPNCRCKPLPIAPKDIEKQREETEASVESDPVERSFRNGKDRESYRQYRQEYDEFFDNMSATDKENIMQADNVYPPPIFEDIRNKMIREMPLLYDGRRSIANRWQETTTDIPPMSWKLAASEIEDGADYVFTPGSHNISEYMNSSFAMDNYEDLLQEHIKVRAFNQSYMKAKGVDKVVVYRGIEGDIGNSLREQARLAVDEKRHRTKFTVTDSSISGYSDDLDTAAGFGEDGIVWKTEVPASDIIVHKDLLSGVTKRMTLEHEYLLKGGSFEVNLENMYVGMVPIMKGVE